MADNYLFTQGSGSTGAADEIGGVLYPRAKLIFGPDGTNTGDVSTTNPLPVAVYPVAAGGATPYRLISAATTNATNVKASAGQLFSISLTNSNSSTRYVKFYNKASSPTVGTDTTIFVIGVPGLGGFSQSFPTPKAFSTGISFAITTGAADSDTGAVAANEVIVNMDYA